MRTIARRIAALATTLGLASVPIASASASETAYEYDALGRLVRANQIGGPAPSDARYAYDPADNRINVSISGAPADGGVRAALVIVPAAGRYRIIPLRRQ